MLLASINSIYSVVKDRESEFFDTWCFCFKLLFRESGPGNCKSRAKLPAKRLQFAGEFTARVTPVPIPNTEVKPRWADGTARESVWEIR